jgi:RNA polymerase sporulation-specific sigma factor
MIDDTIITGNMGLVYACANRFKAKGVEYDDLVQAGSLGLIKAANNFDTERGVKFSTYAVPVILGEIKKLFRDGGTIKVGRTLKELSMKVSSAANTFFAKEGRSPTIEELSAILSVDKEKITQALTASQVPLSLTLFESDSDEGKDTQMDIPTEGYEERLTDVIALRQVINELDESDRNIIKLRFFRNMTQCLTAKALNMTQVQVSRREKKILALMRAKMTG